MPGKLTQRVIGSIREVHALPVLRPDDRHHVRYVQLVRCLPCKKRAVTDSPCATASMYMMCRMVLGHKTWFGKG